MSRCPGCGFPLAETTDPERARAYVAEMVHCAACDAAEREDNVHRDRNDGKRLPGHRPRPMERPPLRR